jgi:glycosyltransferase involved in cell wall biosynthesis
MLKRRNQAMVSVIIPTHRGANLKPLFTSLELSTYRNFETIIVDEGLERSAQRNIGIDRAKGEYFLFLDSDMAVHPRLIEECVEIIKYCYGIYLPEKIMTKGLFAKIRNFERQFYTGTAVDCVRFVRAYRCPRFDEAMSGPEDSDWDRRILGSKMTATYPVYHFDNINLLGYCKKKAYYSKSMKEFAKKNQGDLVLNLHYRCWKIFTENGKWKKLLNPLTLGVIFILAVRGVIYFANTLSSK